MAHNMSGSGMIALATALLYQAPAMAAPAGLLFHVSADRALAADQAGGDAQPNFLSRVALVPDGKSGSAIRWQDDGVLTWNAPGNIYGRRGTLSFFWRSRTPVGVAPFVLFRVGFADHSSWDMTFLRIDWNGHGFDAFVTDTNLARVRVSFKMDTPPAPDAWRHIAFAWDETVGVRLYVDGREVARTDRTADLDSGLDQLGLAGRVVSPHQVQSRYNFMRGGDFDELRIYDHMLSGTDIAALSSLTEPATAPPAAEPAEPAERAAWLHRYGWDRVSPPVLDAAVTRIRRVEFSTARDLKQEMLKGIDGIEETTWPGVYNRSRLPGRDDYFELPDWNTYVEGGKNYDLSVPPGEKVNRIELRGAAYGTLSYDGKVIDKRPRGIMRSVTSFPERIGGMVRFSNVAQETPIQEVWAYDVAPGKEPDGTFKLSYTVRADAAPARAQLAPLTGFIDGRFPPEERTTLLALPTSGSRAAAGAGDAAGTRKRVEQASAAPLVHILIPSGFGDALPGEAPARAWNYGWENVHDGLDGVAIDIPAMDVTPGKDGLIPLDIRVKDPLWPQRDMIDVQVSVRPREARTVWLDLRDRILTDDPLYLSIASASADFGAKAVDGMNIRLVFKAREAAKAEHVADRFNQVKDNWGFLVEEHTASKREGLYRRLYADISDLLRVDPDHVQGRLYWQDISYNAQSAPDMPMPQPTPGVPLWAFRQLEDLKLVRQFVDWWIDNRQVPYGDFGGGISDDVDLTQQWPGLALMGVEPEKINASLRALSDAVYKNGMRTNGLGTITTDELHAYEEGLNSDAQRLYLNWGEPKAVERLMATVKALTGIITVNPAGHMHFASNWYGGRIVYREGPWEWQKPYSFTVMHAPILIGVYNGNPTARNLVTGVIDGWMAHGKQGADGRWTYPNEINWRTDAERVGDGGGATTPLQAAWASWRFTGDAKYLRPLEGRVASGGASITSEINENPAAVASGELGRLVAAKPPKGDFGAYAAWNASGDIKPLEKLHGDAIQDKLRHQYMLTEGHWWSDRVEQPNDLLQRERLGGIALKRNQTYPGNTVSWRFDNDGAAEQVAILLPGATPARFKVVAYNMSDVPQAATMSTWNVTAGRWRMTRSVDGAAAESGDLDLERSGGARVSFPPHATTIYEFSLTQAGTPTEQRPDIGIGTDDLAVSRRTARLTIHSLGGADAPAGVATIEDARGRVLASAPIPAMAAPRDLMPQTINVALKLPAEGGGGIVRIRLADGSPEVTQHNNQVSLPDQLAVTTGKDRYKAR
ncbi:LamG-like jellyroll fold domain-containing protein [Sphingomonas crusticola]|uniref:LamG-like jellyroll fold domain-containing protein n=1 Tax=Sphingomonas crusticola TaxID=1697973 RepID=UPI000E224DC3|nr:LamG-like jellyroll fold domain-containing protein [Sphingomonas crusticola]